MVTPTQHRIYEFVKQYIAERGYSPSLIEIAQGIGVRSKSLISRYVHALAQAGWIDLVPGETRQIRLKTKAANQVHIPLVGRIAAGRPIEAISDTQSLNIVDMLIDNHSNQAFALEVKGDSMIEEGILDGDIVLCERRESASNGEIVVALVDNQEATLKRIYYQPNGSVILAPANAALQPQVYAAHQVTVQGVFKGLIRLKK